MDVTVVCSFFSLLCSSSLHEYTIIYLPLMDIWVVSTLGAILTNLAVIFPLGGNMHAFLLGIYAGVELLDHCGGRHMFSFSR